jgi:hypothetical protein
MLTMEVTHIDDIPINEYPIFKSMLNSTLVRFSKWECAKYWETKGRKYMETLSVYDKHIGFVDKIVYENVRK